MNCYFYKSLLIFIIRLYSQSPRFIIFSRSKTSSHQLFINVLFILYKLLFLWELINFHVSILFIVTRHYSQSLDTLFLRARKCFLLIVNVFCVIALIVIITFKAFSQHLYLNNAPRAQRPILLSQFINCLKRSHKVLQ